MAGVSLSYVNPTMTYLTFQDRRRAVDVQFFLERRLAFIRRYHATAVAPFQEIVRKIEADEERICEPPHAAQTA